MFPQALFFTARRARSGTKEAVHALVEELEEVSLLLSNQAV
jgi:hypothetical protein